MLGLERTPRSPTYQRVTELTPVCAPASGSRVATTTLALILVLFGVGANAGTSAPTCDPPERRIDTDLARAVDAAVDAAREDGFSGGVTVVRDGVVVYERVTGFADRRGKTPVTENTLFHVASISKYLTAVLALTAVQHGKIALEDPIADWIDSDALARRNLTWLDLLAHRSGMGSSYAAERIGDPDEAVAAIARSPVDAERVGGFRYSNDNYDLLAVLLEKVWGSGYEDAARAVLARACLTRAGFWGEVDLTDARRVGQPLRRLPRRLRQRNYGMLGSAGFLITASDLARLELAIATHRLLDPARLAELRAPRGAMSLGQATLGAFLVESEALGPTLSARGSEDWGDNAILNHYLAHDLILAVVTSKGPAEKTGKPAFRTRLARAIERILAERVAVVAR